MSKPQPTGRFATPWGVEVDAFPPLPGDDPDSYTFNMAGTAVCMGIHDPDAQRRFADAASKMVAGSGVPVGTFMDLVVQFGGMKPPRIALAPVTSADSVFNNLPPHMPEIADITVNWIERVQEERRWHERAARLLEMVGGHVEQWHGHLPHEIIALSLGHLMTAVLENLGESEIDCLEAAAFYALSAHDPWRTAAVEWLKPIRKTWWADWIGERPRYRRFATMTAKIYDEQPRWLAWRAN
ncbi:MAG TPA: hypothetical protein VD995_04490 [Azospirillum sp.]|nr:hypothetical protein [Azospirillum sp.]